MEIRKGIAAAVFCLAFPVMVSGCANSAKAGTEALEKGDYKEARCNLKK